MNRFCYHPIRSFVWDHQCVFPIHLTPQLWRKNTKCPTSVFWKAQSSAAPQPTYKESFIQQISSFWLCDARFKKLGKFCRAGGSSARQPPLSGATVFRFAKELLWFPAGPRSSSGMSSIWMRSHGAAPAAAPKALLQLQNLPLWNLFLEKGSVKYTGSLSAYFIDFWIRRWNSNFFLSLYHVFVARRTSVPI